jgi:glycine oxidase ThiO
MKTVTIAGAGIMGLASAWRLAQRGWSVRMFDLRKAAREASRAAAGMLAPGGEIDSNAALAQMALRSLAMYPEFVRNLKEESGLPVEFSQCGAVEVAFDGAQEKALAEKAVRQAAIGIASNPCHYQNRNARHYPTDAIVDPLSVTHALLAACRKRGVEIHEHEPVIEILPDGSGVRTHAGDYRSDRVLIAAGAWSSALFPGLPKVYPVRGHLVYFEMEPGLLKTVVRNGHTYVLQRESGGVVAGSSMEDAGFDRTLDTAIVEDIHRQAAKLVPQLADVTPVDCWNGLRPATDVGPVIGRVADTNIWTAYGHFRNGILLTPDTAQTIANEFDAA